MRGKEHGDEVKAQVMAALLTGQSVNAVAREYSVPEATIRRWKNGGDSPLDGPQKKDIGELLLLYLQANLEALTVQTQMFQNMKWLAQQNAADLAVLHGVMIDKDIRILEALNKGSGNE
jgi:transposase-like protein